MVSRYLIVILTVTLSVLTVFNGVLSGDVITNNFYLFAYEPWAHHIEPGMGNYNYMLSDDMDVMSVGFPTTHLIQRGELPLWNRYWQLGLPEFRIDSGWFYPLRWFWVLCGIPVGMTIEVLVRFVLGGIFSFLLLEILGIHPFVSLLCSIGYIFGSNSIGDYMYGFGPIGLALPIVCYAIERSIKYRGSKELLFLTLSLIYLNTHIMIHTNALTSLWLGFYTLVRICFEQKRADLFKHFLTAALAAIGLFAFAIIPTLSFYLNYFNSEYRTSLSLEQLAPGGLLTIFYNNFFGNPLLEKSRYLYGSFTGSAIFIGFIGGISALSTSWLRLCFRRDRFIIPVTLTAFFLFLTIYRLPFERLEAFFQFLPLLEFTSPLYQRPVFQFFLMLFGALGADFLWRIHSDERRLYRASMLSSILVTLLSSYLFIRFYTSAGPSTNHWHYFLLLSGAHLITIAVFLGIKNDGWLHFLVKRSPRLFQTLAIVMLVASVLESRENAAGWIPYSKLNNWYPKTQTTEYLRNNLGDSRVISLDQFAVPGLLYGYHVPIAAGRSYPRSEYLELLRLAHPDFHKDHPTQSFFPLSTTNLSHPVWKLANVNFFLAGKGSILSANSAVNHDEFQTHQFIDGTIFERRKHSEPYIVTTNAIHSQSVDETKSLLRSGHRIDQTIIISDPTFKPPSTLCSDPSAEVSSFRLVNNYTIELLLANNCPVYLQLSMFYDPGWSADIDGLDTPIYQAYGFLPAIKIETSGTHQIRFHYRPVGLGLGGGISLFTLLIFFVFLTRRSSA